MTEKKRIPLWGGILLSILLVITFLGAGFLVWALTPAQPMPEVFEVVPIEQSAGLGSRSWLTFVPDGGLPVTGLILYPGGHVDFRAYAPTAQAIADEGYLVVLVRMPLNLAVMDPAAAADVIAAYPDIQNWAVGGHSLGGAMAANFVYSNPGDVDGLVLWASYPAGNNDLSEYDIRVVSVSGSLDGLSTPGKIDSSISLLPGHATWVSITGGNHAQFGWYGEQSGDNPATISRQEQQEQVIQATIELLASFQ